MKSRCEKHPKYRGKKKPDNGCIDCLNVYLQRIRIRVPIKPTMTHGNIKYSRKEKHRKGFSDE